MRGVGTSITRTIQTGSTLLCDDNSGAKVIRVIGVVGWKTRRKRQPKAGIGDLVIVSVKKGSPQIRKKIERAVIVRQRKEIRRPNGIRVFFEDNAAVLVDEEGLPKGTEIKGAIAREVAERFPKVAGIAASVA